MQSTHLGYQKHFSVSFWAVLFVTLSASYLFAIPYQYSGAMWHKAVPIFLLTLPVLRYAETTVRSPLLFALLLSACGDVLLASDLPNNFEMGLGAFLCAHLAYIRILWRWQKMNKLDYPLVASVLLLMIALGGWILPHVGSFFWPVAVYMSVIGAMVILALIVKPVNLYLSLGATLFVISDTLIAINKFVQPLPYYHQMIMLSYYLAQLFLAFSIIQQSRYVAARTASST